MDAIMTHNYPQGMKSSSETHINGSHGLKMDNESYSGQRYQLLGQTLKSTLTKERFMTPQTQKRELK